MTARLAMVVSATFTGRIPARRTGAYIRTMIQMPAKPIAPDAAIHGQTVTVAVMMPTSTMQTSVPE